MKQLIHLILRLLSGKRNPKIKQPVKTVCIFQESMLDALVSINNYQYGGIDTLDALVTNYPNYFFTGTDENGVEDFSFHVQENDPPATVTLKRPDGSIYTVITQDWIGPRPPHR
jgi:hypothetical protein